MNQIVEFKNVSKSFVTSKELTKVLDDISFKINRGQIVSIVGPSGCGKSTILNIISNLEKEDEGKVLAVSVDEFGKVNTVAKQIEEIISAEKISYSNNDVPGVNNIKDAIDYLIEHQGEGGIVNPGSSNVEWDDIQNKPTLGSKMYINENQLVLVDKDDIIISAVDLVTDEDIDSLLED